MQILPPNKVKIVEIKGKGRGVVATENIKLGEIIEVCPTIFISKEEAEFTKNSEVLKYYCLEQYAIGKSCVMLGYGSIYNHSKNPNADIEYNEEKPENYLTFRAIKDIKTGEEIVYDYEFDNNVEEFLV